MKQNVESNRLRKAVLLCCFDSIVSDCTSTEEATVGDATAPSSSLLSLRFLASGFRAPIDEVALTLASLQLNTNI